MNLRKYLALGGVVFLLASPGSARRNGGSNGGGTVSPALKSAHTRQVEESLRRFLDASVLSPVQAQATRDGLAAFLESRALGMRESGPAIPVALPDFEPTAALLEATGSGIESDDGLIALPSGLNSIGAVVCTVGDELLVNGRFVIVVTWQGFVGGPARAFSCRMTNSAGYFFFQDRNNIEIPIKMINACFGGIPASHWVFAAGLTNLGIEITVFDLFTGLRKSYLNTLGQTFNTQIDQATPFPCP